MIDRSMLCPHGKGVNGRCGDCEIGTLPQHRTHGKAPEAEASDALPPAGGKPTRGGAETVAEQVKMPGVYMAPDHRYWWNGEGPAPSVTTVLSILDKPAVVVWKAQNTARAIIENWPIICDLIANTGQESAVKWALAKADEQRDTAAKIGSGVHLLADMVPRASEKAVEGFPISEQEMPYVQAFRGFMAFLEARGAVIVSSEKAVWSLNGYAGTYDLLVQFPCELIEEHSIHEKQLCGETQQIWLIDIKTGKQGTYPEYGLQLAAYRWADYIVLPGDPRPYPMPMIHRTAVLHLRPDTYDSGWRLIEFPTLYDLDYLPFLGLLEAFKWQKQGRFTKSKLVGRQSPGYQKPKGRSRKRQGSETQS